MATFYQEPDHTIYSGHALDILREMSDEFVDMAITSPPYWGLRTYKTEPIIWGENHCEHEWGADILRVDRGTAKGKTALVGNQLREISGIETKQGNFCLKCNAWRGELGLEPTIELYIQHLILIFNEVKRVLKKTGTCWVNLDDSYAGGKGQSGCGDPEYQENRTDATLNKPYHQMGGHGLTRPADGNIGIPAKSLCLIPERFVIAMVENGWILRNDIVWNKSNPMPESVKDRFTGSWEHLFFFVKSKKYWFEQQFEPVLPASLEREKYGWNGTFKGRYDVPWEKRENCKDQSYTNPLGRNKRDVWEINTQANPFDLCLACGGVFEHAFGKPCPVCHEINWSAHFATFPEKLCETPILAGCPSMICKKCGKAREKVYDKGFTGHQGTTETNYQVGSAANRLALLRQAAREQGGEYANQAEDKGYTDCGCNAGFEPGVVLDPFTGSGTAQAVAKRLGRKSIGIELNSDYCKLAAKRLQGIPMAMPLKEA